jgi:hypothetical protein
LHYPTARYSQIISPSIATSQEEDSVLLFRRKKRSSAGTNTIVRPGPLVQYAAQKLYTHSHIPKAQTATLSVSTPARARAGACRGGRRRRRCWPAMLASISMSKILSLPSSPCTSLRFLLRNAVPVAFARNPGAPPRRYALLLLAPPVSWILFSEADRGNCTHDSCNSPTIVR